MGLGLIGASRRTLQYLHRAEKTKTVVEGACYCCQDIAVTGFNFDCYLGERGSRGARPWR